MPPSIPIQSSPEHETTRHHDIVKVRNRAKSSRQSGAKKDFKKKQDINRVERTESGTASTDHSSGTTSLGASGNTSIMQGTIPYGMYGSPYGYGGMSPAMVGGPFSGLYQVLFGVQNIVFSLGQAVQILGMNQQALQEAFDSLTSMFDHAIATFHELRALEAMENETETEEQKKRRRRLKAVRWAMVMGTSWLLYKIIRRATSRRRRLQYNNNPSNANAASYLNYPIYSAPRGYNGLYGSLNPNNPYGFGSGGYYGLGGNY